MTVNTERVRLLVEALESDEFQQGRFTLTRVAIAPVGQTVELDCCLGVACKLAIRDEVIEIDRSQHHNGTVTYDGTDTVLPTTVQQWYGFDYFNPPLFVRPGSWPDKARTVILGRQMRESEMAEAYAASALNDTFEFTFKELADAFRYTYLEDHIPTDGGKLA